MGERVLIVDDERAARVGLKRALGKGRYELTEAGDGDEALARIAEVAPHLVILDLNMPRRDGASVLAELAQRSEAPRVIVLTAYGSEKRAVEAMKLGAFDYLTKPYDVEELRLTVARALETVGLERENARLRKALDEQTGLAGMVGASPAMQRIAALVARIAEPDVSVLLRGESGTGKELVARAIHERSPRRDGPFVAINAAALPETLIESELFGHVKGAFTGAESDRKGKFELADGGTLLLDEIGDMSLEVQAKLLRALEQRVIEPLGGGPARSVDVRVIAATHKDLDLAMREGRFRQDLYFRLKVVELELPRLADRVEDIPALAHHFAERFAARHGRQLVSVTPEAVAALQARAWPGNVRELKNLIEGALAMCSSQTLDASDLPLSTTPEHGPWPFDLPADLYSRPFSEARKEVLRAFEKDFITRHLEIHKGNVSRTAQALGMHRQSLQQKVKELDIPIHQLRDV